MDEMNGSIYHMYPELYVRFSIDNDVSKSMILCMRVLD
jgi:hypothetical protein